MAKTDPDRLTTYAAEDLVVGWLDGVDPENGEVAVTLVSGEAHTFSPEAEPRFSRPQDVQPFVDRVLERLCGQARQYGSRYRGREKKPVRVSASRGVQKATYFDGDIYLPARERGGAWALRAFVVLHELAHHLNTGIDGAIIDSHGEGFRKTFTDLLEDLGWVEMSAMLSEGYRWVGLDRQRRGNEGMLAKIGKLLRHAEGASTEKERDAFLTKAQELATLHSIELALARAEQQRGESVQKPTFESVKLGHRGAQGNVRFIELMLAITRANDLHCSIRTDNTGVTLYGMPSDIEVVKALYSTLVVQMVADADRYLRSGAHRPVHGRTARAAFYAGWTDRIEQRLQQARQAAKVQAEALAPSDSGAVSPDSTASATPTALALVAKQIEIDDYFATMRRQHGVAGTWRGSSAAWDPNSMGHGSAAADRARLGATKELTRPHPTSAT